ncbi:MAG: hypothetical protein ACK5L4_18660 [Pseudanabaena sp.]|jgi:hypothetical protein
MTGIRDEHAQIKMLNRQFLIDELLLLGNIGGRKELVDFLRLTRSIVLSKLVRVLMNESKT